MTSVAGHLIQARFPVPRRHMKGLVNAKMLAEFVDNKKRLISTTQPDNLLYNSSAQRENLNYLALPNGRDTLAACCLEELGKALAVSQVGGVTSGDGRAICKEQLQRIVQVYFSMEIENTQSTVYFIHERVGNGLFAAINTSEQQTVPSSLAQLVTCRKIEPSLQRFFANIKGIMAVGAFTHGYSAITMEAPELSEQTVYKVFVHVGKSVTQKNIVSKFSKVLEMDAVLYHTNAWTQDCHSIYIISKQQVSMIRDEKTHNQTAMGKRSKFGEYLVMMQIGVHPTTIESHGHTLGVVGHAMHSYCASCKAGCVMCYHRGLLIWMQYLHFDEGRPTPKPVTISFCSWVPSSRSKRNCSNTNPVSKLKIEK